MPLTPEVGATRWYVPDAFIPEDSTNGIQSHESLCLLNTTADDVTLQFTAYFADQDPVLSQKVVLPSQRAVHYRTTNPEQIGGLDIPVGVPYALAVTSSAPICAQYSRLDTSAGYSMMTAIPVR